jgi:integrase
MIKARKIGLFSVRPHIRSGVLTGGWQIDIPAEFSELGRRQRLFFSSEAEAVTEAKQRAANLMRLSPNVLASRRVRVGMTFEGLVEGWCRTAEANVSLGKRRPATLEAHLHHLKAILPFIGRCDLSEVDEDKLQAYQLHRTEKGRKPATVNGEVGTITLILGWAKKRGAIREVPSIERMKVEQKNLDLPSIEEMRDIIAAFPPRLQVLVLLFAETGCRKSEIFNLPWQHFNEVKGEIYIRRHRGWEPKNPPSTRTIPLSPEMLTILRRLPKNGYYIFPGRDGDKPINNFRKAMKTALKNSEVERDGDPIHLTPHMIRKAYTTWQTRRGVELTALQQLVGHVKGSRVTQRDYINPSEDDRSGAVLRLGYGEHSKKADHKILATTGNKLPDRKA